MKKLLLAALLLVPALWAVPSTTRPHIRAYDFSCPTTIIAGSRTICQFRPLFAFDFSANSSTGVFTVTAGGYVPQNGDIITLETTGTLPGGLYTLTAAAVPNYAVCQVSSNTFKMERTGNPQTVPSIYNAPWTCTGTTETITTNGTGTHTASLYEFATARPYYDPNPTGFPMGTTFATLVPASNIECSQAANLTSGLAWSVGEGPFCPVISVPSNATPGSYTGHFKMCDDSSCTHSETYDHVMNVIAPPSLAYTPPATVTAIPGLSNWEFHMVNRPLPGSDVADSGPANYCPDPIANPPAGSMIPTNGVGIGFYSWGKFWFDMAHYTGNPVWATGCGLQMAQNTRDYIVAQSGSMVTYSHFTDEMYVAARYFHDTSYSDAGDLMKNNIFTYYGPVAIWSYGREMAYSLMDTTANKKYSNITNPRWADQRDAVISIALQSTETGASQRINQNYLNALDGFALIQDWQLSGDARIPYVIKRIADTIYSTIDSHHVMNLPAADGSFYCSSTLLWFMDSNDGHCLASDAAYWHLGMMSAPIFQWLYAYTGDTTYRDEGDEIFSHGLDLNYTNSGGKDASQDFWFGFSGVCWRNKRCSVFQLFEDLANSISSVTPQRDLTSSRLVKN